MALFTVTSVTERATLNAAGNLVNQIVVTLQTLKGATGQVSFSADEFEALTATDEGKAAIQERLAAKADALDSPFGM